MEIWKLHCVNELHKRVQMITLELVEDYREFMINEHKKLFLEYYERVFVKSSWHIYWYLAELHNRIQKRSFLIHLIKYFKCIANFLT